MRSASPGRLVEALRRKRGPLPNEAQWELTYRCNLACGHCYCRGMEKRSLELSARQIKRRLKRLRKEGCLWLSLTGGEPLMREDFLDIYGFAREQGFIITVLTNGLLWTDSVIRAVKKAPPHSIELTVNGATAGTYEAVTGVPGSFERLRDRARALFRSGLPVIVKSNLLKPNQGEIGAIKRWVEENLGRPKNGHFFKYDPHVVPRLDRGKGPLAWRLSYEEVAAASGQDMDMKRQLKDELARDFPGPEAPAGRLYQCSLWQDKVFVSPDGFARFCPFSRKFGFDLRTTSLESGARRNFEPIAGLEFQTRSKCRSCELRPICFWCPAKAGLETGCEEKPVAAYCRYAARLAEETALRKPDAKRILSRVQP